MVKFATITLMIIAILIILGLCFGSFINALVWRVHEQSKPKKKRVATDAQLSIAQGRSMCPHCQHVLAWYDLLPVISWVGLRGKCRYCNKPISRQYPLIEILTAGLFVVSYVWWPTDLGGNATLLFGIWLASLVGLVALMVYDIRWMLLPNRVVFPIMVLGALSVGIDVMSSDNPLKTALLALASVAVAGGLFYVLFQVSQGRWIGGGDVKLGFALGLLLGAPDLAFLMLFVASILGLLLSLPALLLKKTKLSGKIPFGPFLIIGTIIVKLFGASVISWYSNTFLYL